MIHFCLRKFRWFHMTCLDKMRIACGILLCYRKDMMFSLIGNTFTAIFISFDILFYNSFLFKGISYGLCYCRCYLFHAFHPHDTTASVVIPLFYTYKSRRWDTMFCKSLPHGILIGRNIDTFCRIMRKSQLLCQILHRNICKIRCYGCYRIRLDLTAFL